ncbi:2-hydroxy-3-oxopropionate reductase [Sphaerochaeta pleomorpha str. Grapes]|uniref:2-hydroxy-3-oxopropionate reductase n=1 Tax=Sphaerochaeta pleomorpha (strain ATCC BAA-1885 / DSM 22778 / Grapes) TaxID=158190 RepID=G8QV33_SPHPG|nr:2-hydroxy-3-oxopropionate reductase [Sphaerochaeta pleomorpha]AEV29269.1 2-hydroxy-3-oxopropionate reductase [Sphaerochaeta pleomorpha str. Grapes]
MMIGFIGLGIMGKPMAKNLLKAGYSLTVNDLNKDAVAEVVSCGAVSAPSAKEVAAVSDIVLTMLPNSPHVKQVVLGEGGVIESMKEGTILVDMSSISPIVSQEVSAALAKKGIVMFDAPVSGGEPKAVDGTLAIMVGGPEASFAKVEDILKVMGGSVTLVGEIGSGNITKLANQIMVAANIAGMSEALVLATKANVDPEKVYRAIRGGLAGSTVLDAKAPLVLHGNFKPGFRIDLHIKDLQNALDTASSLETPAPISKTVIDMMKTLSAEGKGSDDHGGLIQWYEKEAKIEVRS